MFKKVKTDQTEAPSFESVTPMATVVDEMIATKRGVSNLGASDVNKPSVISEGFSLAGDIVSEGVLHIEGKTTGTIKAGSINIGPRGQVEGNLACASLHIKGSFSGSAVCSELVVASSAVVKASITYQSLTISRGATIEGDLTVKR